jgi:hypothetical protein
MTNKVKLLQKSLGPYSDACMGTFELVYPRMIHSELLTHKQLSRNCASSRAIPIEAMLKEIENDIAVPVHWGKNQAGMQAKEELQGNDRLIAQDCWDSAAVVAIAFSRKLAATGVHKQVANRITEPYQHMKTVMSGTDWKNVFYLRNHKDADPTIALLFKQMQELWENTEVQALDTCEWHTPYIDTNINYDRVEYLDENFKEISMQEALKISASCCAQTSFRKNDSSVDKADMVYDRLVNSKPVHASPFEHQAKPMRKYSNPFDASQWEPGITHVNRKGELFSGNLRGWVQHRQLIEGNFLPG